MKSLLTNLGLSIGSIAVFFLALEAYLFVRYENEIERLEKRYRAEKRELCTQPHAKLVYTFVPGRCGANAQGFDDEERELRKREGVYRIVLIGDSVAQGVSVDRKHRFSTLAEQQLEARTQQPIEIVNLSVRGYSTSQEVIVLGEIALAYEPDLILWSYVLNDPAHPVYHDANGQLGRYFYRPQWRGGHYLRKKFFDVRERYLARNCEPEFHRLLHCVYQTDIQDNLAQIAQLAQPIPVVFMIHPTFVEGNSFSSYEFQSIHKQLADWASDLNFAVVDFAYAYRDFQATELNLDLSDNWFDPWHLNERGHQVTAEYLVEWIDRNKL